MLTIKIDQEFKSLIPPLSTDEYSQLEQNLINDGIRDPLVLWNNTLIDGHNRYEIAQKYNLDFETIDKDFEDRDGAKLWIISNQLGRRNLLPAVRIKLAMTAEPIIAAKAKENSLANLKQNQNTDDDKCRYRKNETEKTDESIRADAPFLRIEETLQEHQSQQSDKDKNKTNRQHKTNYQVAKLASVSDKSVERYKNKAITLFD